MWLSKLGGSVASRALRADSFAGQPERAQHGTSFAPMLHVQNALKMQAVHVLHCMTHWGPRPQGKVQSVFCQLLDCQSHSSVTSTKVGE